MKKCQLRKLQNQIPFSNVKLRRDASVTGVVSCWRFPPKKSERRMLMLSDTGVGVIGDHIHRKRQAGQNNKKINMIWGSRVTGTLSK